MADFTLIARRTLSAKRFSIFELHFLWGLSVNQCCEHLAIEKGPFYFEVYRIQEQLGRTYRELEPHPLFPLDEYFHGRSRVLPTVALLPLNTSRRSIASPFEILQTRDWTGQRQINSFQAL